LEGIVWRFRTGSPWRDLPSEFGVYQSVWERHRRWSTDGTYNTMVAVVKADATDEDRQLMGTISVDSTSIRAHQHAAGARFHDRKGHNRMTRICPASRPIMLRAARVAGGPPRSTP